MYKYLNKNPLNREVSDCVVRAISLAQNKSWDDAYEELTEYARFNGTLLDDVTFVEPYLNKRYKKVCYRCKDVHMTVGEFSKLNPIGTYLITMRGHITCLIDGTIYDTWDCRDKILWTVWKIKK